MVGLEVTSRYARAEGAGGVERGAGVEDAGDFGDEETEADADGGDEGAFVFLGGEHENAEDEEGGQELRVVMLVKCDVVEFGMYGPFRGIVLVLRSLGVIELSGRS